MIESPLIDEYFAERFEELLAKKTQATAQATAQATTQRDILAVLETRFGEIPRDLAEDIGSVTDEDRLTDLVRKAASCPDLEAFGREVK